MTTKVILLMAAALVAGQTTLPAADTVAGSLAFRSAAQGGFEFDTGLLRGKLRPGGRAVGLSSVVHIPTGLALDRGDKGYGILSHYRVFSDGKRYGTAAWDWPCTTRLRPGGEVEVTWPADQDRPFVLRAVYRLVGPDSVELETEVLPQQDLSQFEVFLASYFAGRFTNAMVCVREGPEVSQAPVWMAAEKSFGDWQMFPRNSAAAALIQDGRWALPPNPVKWVIRPQLFRPQAARRDPHSGLAAVLMAPEADCFAVAMPHQSEGHFSTYLSLFGRDAQAGKPIRTRARLTVVRAANDRVLLDVYPPTYKP